jgi:hypothetical protein
MPTAEEKQGYLSLCEIRYYPNQTTRDLKRLYLHVFVVIVSPYLQLSHEEDELLMTEPTQYHQCCADAGMCQRVYLSQAQLRESVAEMRVEIQDVTLVALNTAHPCRSTLSVA